MKLHVELAFPGLVKPCFCLRTIMATMRYLEPRSTRLLKNREGGGGW